MTTLRTIVSPYVGLVRSVDERLAGTSDAPLPTYTAELAADIRLLGSPLDRLGTSCGIAPEHGLAIDAALGEVIERYSLSYLPWERLVRATAAELGPGAVDPDRFGLFSAAQHAQPGFPFVPFTRDTAVWWIDGRALGSDEPAWLPAELVFLADVVRPGEERIGYATSSGAACATDEHDAVLRGLLELCERDAFQIVWSNRLSLPLLDWSDNPRLLELEQRYFAPSGLRYSAVDMSVVHDLPLVLGVVRAPLTAAAALGVGAGAAATVEGACWKALSEAFGTRAAARSRVAAGEARAFASDGRDVATFEDHILFHASAERTSLSAFLDASHERAESTSVSRLHGPPRAQLRAVTERVEAAGSSAYAVDVTAPDARRLGLHVAKTIAPELCMLDVPHGARFLGSPRLYAAAAQIGLRERPLPAADVNPYPHPFP